MLIADMLHLVGFPVVDTKTHSAQDKCKCVNRSSSIIRFLVHILHSFTLHSSMAPFSASAPSASPSSVSKAHTVTTVAKFRELTGNHPLDRVPSLNLSAKDLGMLRASFEEVCIVNVLL